MDAGPVDILVIDDEQGMRDFLVLELGERGYRVATAQNGQEALERLKEKRFALVLSDISMPKVGGLEVLDAVKKASPETEVVLMTGYGTIETAVAAMKRGAYDFVQKPFGLDQILAVLRKALEKNDLKALVAIHEASKAVFRSIKLEDILPVIAELTVKLLKADDASVMLLSGERLEVAACAGLDGGGPARATVALGERVAGRVAKGLEAVTITGPLCADPRFAGVEALRAIEASIVQPLVAGGETLGVLNANRTSRVEPFNAADLRHMEILASYAAQAVLNARTYRRLEEAQQQLIHSERINAMGLFAAGVAHELNNPLTSILGCGQLLLQSGRLEDIDKQDVEVIVEQSRRCARIVEDLLQFGRKRKPRTEPVALCALLESALKLARFDLSSQVGVDKSFPEISPVVFADPMQLKQVFLNLIRNAGQAMAASPRKRLSLRVERGPATARVLVGDTGCGIAPEDRAKLFQPFFSTKPAGQGTGLGLSVCASIIEQHRGRISVESAPGAGTTVAVELPLEPAGAP